MDIFDEIDALREERLDDELLDLRPDLGRLEAVGLEPLHPFGGSRHVVCDPIREIALHVSCVVPLQLRVEFGRQLLACLRRLQQPECENRDGRRPCAELI